MAMTQSQCQFWYAKRHNTWVRWYCYVNMKVRKWSVGLCYFFTYLIWVNTSTAPFWPSLQFLPSAQSDLFATQIEGRLTCGLRGPGTDHLGHFVIIVLCLTTFGPQVNNSAWFLSGTHSRQRVTIVCCGKLQKEHPPIHNVERRG